MEPISIEGTPKTPTVKFDAEQGIIEIKGRSIPENSIEFYKPLVCHTLFGTITAFIKK